MESKVPGVKNGKAQVILLAGFLGAGKTTLLKHILSWQKDLSETVVIVNEFGEVGIDGALLDGVAPDVVELTSGCICCTLANDLRKSLLQVWERYHPRRIFIESSGIADPTAIVEVLAETPFIEHLELGKIVTVIDSDFWDVRENFGRLFYHQLELGNLILLNKIDLLEQDQVDVYLKEVHDIVPGSQVVPTIQCRIDPEMLWQKSLPYISGLKPIPFFRPIESEDDGAGSVTTSEGNYSAFGFEDDRPLDEECFNRFMSSLPFSLFRMKGAVRFADRTLLVNHVGGQNNYGPWEGEEGTRLAFVGWGVDEEKIVARLKECFC